LTLHESVLAEERAAQTAGFRCEDCAALAVDPSNHCTFWYVGDYYKVTGPLIWWNRRRKSAPRA
jgi:hypothetical protein